MLSSIVLLCLFFKWLAVFTEVRPKPVMPQFFLEEGVRTSHENITLLQKKVRRGLDVSKITDFSFPPRSPDITVCDAIFVRYVRRVVISTNPKKTLEN